MAVAGAFKVPTLRNVELTAPYMHNGGMSTLEQVVEFYNRGGNFVNNEGDPDIGPIGLIDSEKAALVAFLKTLTDGRIITEKAPFDHPSMQLFQGHPSDQVYVQGKPGSRKVAADYIEVLPAVGKYGRTAQGLPLPKRFWDQLRP